MGQDEEMDVDESQAAKVARAAYEHLKGIRGHYDTSYLKEELERRKVEIESLPCYFCGAKETVKTDQIIGPKKDPYNYPRGEKIPLEDGIALVWRLCKEHGDKPPYDAYDDLAPTWKWCGYTPGDDVGRPVAFLCYSSSGQIIASYPPRDSK